MKPIVITHHNCADGFTSLWIIHNHFKGEIESHPGIYNATPPDCEGRDVIIADFCYSREVMREIALKCKTLLVLDHHETAEKNLKGLNYYDHVKIVFDKSRSGAMIVWDYFHPNESAPPLVHYVQDRDLWKFKLAGTREYQACVSSYPYTMDAWDTLAKSNPEKLIAEGVPIERKHFKDVKELVEATKRPMVIGGHKVMVANVPYTMGSDAASQLAAEGNVFGAFYFDTKDNRTFGLRSAPDGINVAKIAEQYGGGGHEHASGFNLSHADARKLEDGTL